MSTDAAGLPGASRSRTGGVRRLLAGVLATVTLPFVLPACMNLPGGASVRLAIKVHEPVTIWSDATVQGRWGVGAHPFLTRVSTSRVAICYGAAGDGAIAGLAALDWPAYTDDGGATWLFGDPFDWSRVIVPAKTVREIKKGQRFLFDYGYYNGAAEYPDGSRFLRTSTAQAPTYQVKAIAVDAAGRVTNLYSLVYEPLGPTNLVKDLCCQQPSVVMPDGRILSVAYGMPKQGVAKYSMFLYEWLPGQPTSRLVSVVAGPEDAPWGTEGPCEGALARGPDGVLVCAMRVHGGQPDGTGKGRSSRSMLIARSADGGLTWERQRMPQPGVCPKLLFMSNGVLALAFGRPGNYVTFSMDGGRTWGGDVRLGDVNHGTTGYVDLVEVRPGRLLAVYDSMNYTSKGVWLWDPPLPCNALLSCRIDVAPRWDVGGH